MGLRGRRLNDLVPVAAVAAAFAFAPVAMGPSAAASSPRSIAALGDSYTVGLFSGAPCSPSGLCLANSWSTGTSASVPSHLQRLRALTPGSAISAYNYAASGRKVGDFLRQARLAVGARAQYVTVMLGLNDSCRESEAAMTPVSTFRSQFAAGMSTLVQGLPNAKIFVASIPDAERLRALFAGNPSARSAWAAQQVCQVALANPTSTAPADVARRARARQRVIDFNRQLAAVCAQYPTCRYDGGAVFGWRFAAADFVTRDFFHLSARGQASLAAVTWAATHSFQPAPPPPPPPTGSGYAAMIRGDAPVAHWRLGERSGTTAAAATGGPAGRYLGAVALGQAGAIGGDADTAVSLNGRTSYVSVPHAAGLATGDRFTLEAWVKRRTISRSMGLLSKGSRSYQLYLDAGNRVVLRQTGIGEITRSTVALTDRTAFHHVAVTKDGPSVRLYLDGVDRTGPVIRRTVSSTTSALAIGSGAGYFDGIVDEVAIYPRALDAPTIARHHAAG